MMHGSILGFHVRGIVSNTMKNFVRLVQFAWRYKVRFGLSVACAAMVALLSFTEIGAVYPLLHILFGSQDPQHWISEKISGLETEIVILNTREPKSPTSSSRPRAGTAARPTQCTVSQGRKRNLRRRKRNSAGTSDYSGPRA